MPFGKTAVAPLGTRALGLKAKANPLRKTARLTYSRYLKKPNIKPTKASTLPVAARGAGATPSGMKKLAQGRAGRVVKARMKALKPLGVKK